MATSNKIRVGIIGGAGYTGGETIRLLLRHPQAEIVFVHSKSNTGNPVSEIHSDLLGETGLVFTGEMADVDVLFLCLGHGDSGKFLAATDIAPDVKLIDLSQDFRLSDTAQSGARKFVYGLPELNKASIRQAQHIANPGCFATAIQLGLLPLAKAGLLGDVYTTGITGSTGAGQSFSPTSHFSWRANNIQAYKSLQHQHMAEVGQSLRQLQGTAASVHFVPWRGDFPRGIFTSSTLDCTMAEEDAQQLFRDYYSDTPFTQVSSKMIDMKQVVNTNRCVIYPEKTGDKLVVHTAIDNLLKGAAGQAVQNMNLMCGLDERAGLQLKAAFF